ncbi:MAG: 16S rRNA (guanine(527)-N(7))-methyltransferase RsmG [Candidatus Cloacimonas sp.]|nr:16S rRNA (guanine(527)-N(7))-methyltransferase RsmG [Candidatus Cloacimonadota bacterium]
MSVQKEAFRNYLATKVADSEWIFQQFELYHSLLTKSNTYINLLSRQTLEDDIWSLHFQDSLLPLETNIDLNNKLILDFGSGGGLPGIPLALIAPSSEVYMMDSKKKKMREVQSFINEMGLTNCYTIPERLEETKLDVLKDSYGLSSKFDLIVSRSVRIDEILLNKLFGLLPKGGKILLYKGKDIKEKDLHIPLELVLNVKKEWGERNLVLIRKI